MDDPLTTYRLQIDQVEPCSEEWFAQALADARSGDDQARRRIVGSCLRVALRVVDRKAPDLPQNEFLELVQSANYGLVCSLDTFQGSSAEEFVRHAEQAVETHLSRQGP